MLIVFAILIFNSSIHGSSKDIEYSSCQHSSLQNHLPNTTSQNIDERKKIFSSLGDVFYEMAPFLTDLSSLQNFKKVLKDYHKASAFVEILNNGIEDDNDNFVDGFDSDCACEDDGYYENCPSDSEYIPPAESNGINLIKDWTSTKGVTNISQLEVGDMDNDAEPEIAVMREIPYHSSGVDLSMFLEGVDGTLKYRPYTLRIHNRNKGMALDNTDIDGLAEFFYVTADDESTGNSRKVAYYEDNPAGVSLEGSGTGPFDLQWVSSSQITCGLSGAELFVTEDFTVSLADFNYDGTPEIFVGNEIYNSKNGTKIADGLTNSIGSWSQGEFATSYHVMAVSSTINTGGDYTFTPNEDFTGSTEMVYTICDDNSQTSCSNPTIHTLVFDYMSLNISVYLEGAIMQNGGASSNTSVFPLIRDDLRISPFACNNYIPLDDPHFNIADPNVNTFVMFNRLGSGLLLENINIIDSAVVFEVTGDNTIVDKVHNELRSKDDMTTSINTRIGLLQRDYNMDGKTKYINPFDDLNYLFSQLFLYPNNTSFLSNFSSIVEQVPD